MKKSIHPKYYPNVKIACACGAIFATGSTNEAIQTEICSQCHPFYTGKSKLVDSAGRIDKFKARQAKTKALKHKNIKALKHKNKKTLVRKTKSLKSLKVKSQKLKVKSTSLKGKSIKRPFNVKC